LFHITAITPFFILADDCGIEIIEFFESIGQHHSSGGSSMIDVRTALLKRPREGRLTKII
jgi:hypothetical protein